MTVDAHQRLAAIGWFAALPEDLRAALFEAGRLSRRGVGEWVQAEGDEDTGVLAVVEGVLRVYVQAHGGREALISLLPAGGVIGQSVSFGGGPRIVTVTAATPSLVFTLSDRALRRVAAVRPGLWEAVSTLVYAQLRSVSLGLAEMVALPPRARLVSRLLALGGLGDGEVVASQADLAEMIGVTRKAVNGWLGELESKGLVRLGYGRVEVLDRRGLERMLA
ncbi:Crp/Fnr family transcriptional regulator [Caulobacter mirabilis]|uniref:Crp/Fnr family transcriptional regulator n=1 Tax=Caulobacter mirabilis TaxID=69666 RepID=A0A2D2AYK1_9CAUL|nr:Crp/Fnr family transcriptional regulator [Caulobacter mirabilis]ATQ43099.1 Crp/Fnr family transcriptional regulator [Caulobacter mirabilis]